MFNHPFWSKPSNVRKLVLGVILSVVAVYGLPVLQVGVKDSLTPGEKNRIDAENNARDVLVKAIGGGLLFATAWVGFLNYKSSQEKNLAERYQQFVKMLSSDEPFTCIAAIHGLEEIARNNRDYFRRVVEVLQAFIRHSSPWPPLTLDKPIGEGYNAGWDGNFALVEDLLRDAEKTRDDLVLAVVNQSIPLEQALETLSSKKKEDFGELIKAVDSAFDERYKALGSKTQAATNTLVGLRQLDWWKSDTFLNLSNTDLRIFFNSEVDLKATAFIGCNLVATSFSDSDLRYVSFISSILKWASFTNSDLQCANFSRAKDLTPDQLRGAKSCKGATIPKYLYDQFTDEEKAKLGVICANS